MMWEAETVDKAAGRGKGGLQRFTEARRSRIGAAWVTGWTRRACGNGKHLVTTTQ
jgi:hypothetical protein